MLIWFDLKIFELVLPPDTHYSHAINDSYTCSHDKFLLGTPWQNYRVSLAKWYYTILLATQLKRTHPTLTPASKAGVKVGVCVCG